MDSVNRTDTTDDILVKYLLGEASATEQSEVEQWIAASEANQQYYNHFKLIWDESKNLASQSTVDEKAAWDRFMQKVQTEEENEATAAPKGRTIPLQRGNWMRAAAVLIMLIGCGTLYYYIAGPGSTITAQAGNVAMVANLPDGSKVTLNRNSSISYPAKFRGDTRRVTLHGEGFFNVTPDKTKPFIIDADNSSIRVVGTSFNVKSSDDRTEVIVETGIVEVSKKQYAIRVLPHQKATVLKNQEMPIMEGNKDMLYNYYRTKQFDCNNTPLYKFTDILSEAYDVHIQITTPKLMNMPINGTYPGQSLEDILDVLKTTTGATIEKKGTEIILK